MPLFYFHVDDGVSDPDVVGTQLTDEAAAREEAVRAAGEMLEVFDGEIWKGTGTWRMDVTDDRNRLLFTLRFSAEVPSGEVAYVPSRAGTPR